MTDLHPIEVCITETFDDAGKVVMREVSNRFSEGQMRRLEERQALADHVAESIKIPKAKRARLKAKAIDIEKRGSHGGPL